MKFKIGQKVCGIKWLNMPQNIQDVYGINTCVYGRTGIVEKFVGIECDIATYDVVFDGNKYPMFVFEPELESFVRIGEQLLLFEL